MKANLAGIVLLVLAAALVAFSVHEAESRNALDPHALMSRDREPHECGVADCAYCSAPRGAPGDPNDFRVISFPSDGEDPYPED